ncbi:amidase [Hwanghaeella sp.]|uniref:amidase n=1 Tax=Hwanghaeella sp. TaxID=2605943 RepID=UPI003CCC2EDD
MDFFDTNDAMGLAQRVRAGEVTATELLDEVARRIEAVNPTINAVTVDGLDYGRKAIENGLPDGPFTGVPFLLKDLGATCVGLPVTNGTRFNPPGEPPVDDETVRRFKEAGLVIAGRTNSPEWGLTTTTEPVRNGPTRNPWNLEYSAGGSSGGAAAAIAAGIVPAAHGSDGGGSIRVPASCCGLFGLKPSRGRVSSGPYIGDAWSGFATSGVLSRSVRDSAALLDILQGPAPGDPYAAPSPAGPFLDEVGKPTGSLKIAMTDMPFSGVEGDAALSRNLKDAAALCEELGHTLVPLNLHIDGEAFTDAVITIINVHTAALVGWLEDLNGRSAGPDDLEACTLAFTQMGRAITGVDFQNAIETVQEMGRKVGHLLTEVDVILSPTQGIETPKLGYLDMMQTVETYRERIARSVGYTAFYNALGLPAMSVPLHWSEEGLPQGTQFAAAYGNEALLFRLAAQLEDARPWAEKRPPVHA